jgi:HAD superfamily hydrolase (TIGR01509 family)
MTPSTEPDPVALIVFDLDGVLIDFHPERRLEYLARLSGNDARCIHEAIWGSEFERQAEAGAYPTGDEYLAAFGERLGYPLTRTEWIAARREAMTVRPDMLALVRQLRTRVRLALLTNNGSLLGESLPVLVPELYEVFGTAAHATAKFGARKPDPLVYQRLVEHHGVDPGAALFVDDDERNVAGAIAAGLRGIHYQGFDALVGALATHL